MQKHETPSSLSSRATPRDLKRFLHALCLVGMTIFLFFPSLTHAACINPAGIEGNQVYNTTYKTMQFCDGTNWISMKGGTTFTLPPTCTGSNQVLQWDGSAWNCATISGGLTECRVCIKLDSNTGADGAKKCSSYSSGNIQHATGGSGWAQANSGSYGGGKYSSSAWIQCR